MAVASWLGRYRLAKMGARLRAHLRHEAGGAAALGTGGVAGAGAPGSVRGQQTAYQVCVACAPATRDTCNSFVFSPVLTYVHYSF